MDHRYLKELVADRLRSVATSSAVLTEVAIREDGKFLGRPDIVMVRHLFGPEIFIVDTKVNTRQVNNEVMELMRLFQKYANETYLCLPKKKCTSSLSSLCGNKGIGLAAVNVDSDDGPIGRLSKKVQSTWNPNPQQWIELTSRLEKLGLQSLYFA